jgi:DNA-binding response OmpR family regulator
MARLLLIDDDPSLSELLTDFLREMGHTVHCAFDAEEGLRAFYTTQPNLVLLDVTMPRHDGWHALERIRELAATPVVMITARNEEENVLRGFALGADDYVCKPFSFAELEARVQSVLKRVQVQTNHEEADEEAVSPLLHQGDLMLDLTAKRVWRGKEAITLTPTEFKLLAALMQHAGEVLSPQALVREVWGEQYANDVGYVRRYIWHLRRKIEIDPDQPLYIHNEHGYGYRFFALPEAREP